MTTTNDTSTNHIPAGYNWRTEACHFQDDQLARTYAEIDRCHTAAAAIVAVLQEDELRELKTLNDHHRGGLLDALAVLIDSADTSTEDMNRRAEKLWPKPAPEFHDGYEVHDG